MTLKDFEGFSPGEIRYIIELLGALLPYEEVQEKFKQFSEGRSLPGHIIQQIQLKYSDRIKRQSEIYLKNIGENPLFHLKVRLDIAYKILQDSLKKRPVQFIKRGEDDYEVIEKADNVTALAALKLVMQDLAKREELDMEKEKQEPPDVNNSSWNIEDGLA